MAEHETTNNDMSDKNEDPCDGACAVSNIVSTFPYAANLPQVWFCSSCSQSKLLGKSLEESRRLHQTSVVAYAKASFRHAPSVTSWLYASRALKPADSRPPVLTTLVASRMHRFD
jgi:hypothetical protein